jgi:hypothetical protein
LDQLNQVVGRWLALAEADGSELAAIGVEQRDSIPGSFGENRAVR